MIFNEWSMHLLRFKFLYFPYQRHSKIHVGGPFLEHDAPQSVAGHINSRNREDAQITFFKMDR